MWVLPLHAFAYFSNVLAPIWEMPVLDGKVLKVRGGPFYPALQDDLDALVGRGLVVVTDLGHVQGEDGHWRLEGAFSLNTELAGASLSILQNFPEESRLQQFIQELAYAFSSLSDEELGLAPNEDASYADPLVGVGNVVDFAEWRAINYSALAAQTFDEFVPGGGQATMAEKLHLYTRHLHRRLNASA
jgi:hypothetical protein